MPDTVGVRIGIGLAGRHSVEVAESRNDAACRPGSGDNAHQDRRLLLGRNFAQLVRVELAVGVPIELVPLGNQIRFALRLAS